MESWSQLSEEPYIDLHMAAVATILSYQPRIEDLSGTHPPVFAVICLLAFWVGLTYEKQFNVTDRQDTVG